jgi:hypothetical protein
MSIIIPVYVNREWHQCVTAKDLIKSLSDYFKSYGHHLSELLGIFFQGVFWDLWKTWPPSQRDYRREVRFLTKADMRLDIVEYEKTMEFKYSLNRISKKTFQNVYFKPFDNVFNILWSNYENENKVPTNVGLTIYERIVTLWMLWSLAEELCPKEERDEFPKEKIYKEDFEESTEEKEEEEEEEEEEEDYD